MQDRTVQAIQAKQLALSCALRHIITALYHDSEARAAARNQVCDGLESLYAENLQEGAHDTLQLALGELEHLFMDKRTKP